MYTLELTVKLSQAMRAEDHEAINRLLYELEQRLSPEDVDVVLEGLCHEGLCDDALPKPSTPLTACA
jgi:hypothetical protein